MIDDALARAVGLSFVLEKLEPRTPWGRSEKAGLRPFAPADRALLEDALDAVSDAQRLESWRLSDTLGRFREIQGTLAILGGGALSETELFELKRFAINYEKLGRLLTAQDAPARFTLPPLTRALAALDPGGARDPAFSAAQADEELGAIVRRKAALSPDAPEYASLLDDEQRALERVLSELSRKLRPETDALRAAAKAVGLLDFALAKAALAERFGGVRPVLGADALIVEGLKNPSLASFFPLSFRFVRGVTVLTGANMGGKSTALYAVALGAQLALMGLFPFADRLEMPHFSDICLIAGDNQKSGLSEFGAQAALLVGALSHAEDDALILVDELARGTNPEEGAAIAAAVTERLSRASAVSVLTTHFSGVAEKANTHYRARGHMPDETGCAADYEFQQVVGAMEPPREALRVLALLGVPKQIIERAKELIDKEKPQPVK